MHNLSNKVKEFALLEGACATGIVTAGTLAGGPPSTDLEYVLKEAKSAISLAVPLDQSTIEPYLAKKDRLPLEKDFIRANVAASGIAFHLSNYLINLGYESRPVAANLVYRPNENGEASYDPTDAVYPDLAHRYLAVRCGVGHLGKSGNLITTKHGAAVILGAVVTKAELEPTPPLPKEENYCDGCGLCHAACAAGFMDFKKQTKVNLGGKEFTYAARKNLARCDLVCSGFTGLEPNEKWSTWSPGRFTIPEDLNELSKAHKHITDAYAKWPKAPGGRLFYYSQNLMRVSCANCQLICAPEREERKRRFNLLKNSGVVIQQPDGSLKAFPPDEAKNILAAMPTERRALYQ